MNRITTNVDQKLLRTTKFPTEFSQKVDTSKINIPVIKNWAAGEVSKILNYEDDVVIGLLFDLLEGSKFPDIKSLQIQLTGFLDKDAAPFCKELWNLCLDAQKSDTGIPKQLVEAKKLELLQEKIESERVAEEARRRREDERARERELEDIRNRERRDNGRGRGGGGGGRDYDRRPPRDFSRSPPPRYQRSRPVSSRDTDSYVPGGGHGRRDERRYRSRSRTPRRPSRSPPSTKRRRVASRSPSYSPDRTRSRRDHGRRREFSPRPRDRSPRRRPRASSRSSSRPPKRDSRHPRQRSRSLPRHDRPGSSGDLSRPHQRRSRSSSRDADGGRSFVAKDQQSSLHSEPKKGRSSENSIKNSRTDVSDNAQSDSQADGVAAGPDHSVADSSAGASERAANP